MKILFPTFLCSYVAEFWSVGCKGDGCIFWNGPFIGGRERDSQLPPFPFLLLGMKTEGGEWGSPSERKWQSRDNSSTRQRKPETLTQGSCLSSLRLFPPQLRCDNDLNCSSVQATVILILLPQPNNILTSRAKNHRQTCPSKAGSTEGDVPDHNTVMTCAFTSQGHKALLLPWRTEQAPDG